MDDVFAGIKLPDNDHNYIPYFVHEGAMARMERTNKRLWILSIIIFLALVFTNAGWIYYESQFIEEVTIDSNSEGGGNAYGTMISGDGSMVTYGPSKDN